MTGAPLTPAANLWREATRGISTSEMNLHCQSVYLGNGSFTAAGLIGFGGTHGGSSVDLVPAAEDEAGFSVVHPEKNEKKRKKKRDMNGRLSGNLV